jgi:hypothetical protein
MIEPADLRREIQKIRDVALGKSGNKAKGGEMLGRLQGAVMHDLAQTGDLLRLMNDFHDELSRAT